jgi:hypothetical protein
MESTETAPQEQTNVEGDQNIVQNPPQPDEGNDSGGEAPSGDE